MKATHISDVHTLYSGPGKLRKTPTKSLPATAPSLNALPWKSNREHKPQQKDECYRLSTNLSQWLGGC